jgi:uncharacterized protein (DUF362 family)
MSRVSLCHHPDRGQGLRTALAGLEGPSFSGRRVLIKPNFNTADPAPGSTHADTLAALIDELWERGAAAVTLGERSFAPTRRVMDEKGVLRLAQKRGVEVIVFDELPSADWVEVGRPDLHWPGGLKVARPVLEADCLVEACCLKTHQFGGVFTMSLKLAVGVVPGARQPGGYMDALHSSPHQEEMIAEINVVFAPELVVADGVECFVDGGPMTGRRAAGEVTLAGDNRVAVDAAGLACLKRLGANRAVAETPIFGQRQIARAAELGLGPSGPSGVELAAADPASRDYADEVRAVLGQG